MSTLATQPFEAARDYAAVHIQRPTINKAITNTMPKDPDTSDEKVDRVVRAVFGDPDNMRSNPGVIMSVARLEEKQEETNRILNDLRGDFQRVAWIIVTANILGLLALLFKK